MVIVSKDEQLAKAPPSMIINLGAKFTSVSDSHNKKAFFWMESKEGGKPCHFSERHAIFERTFSNHYL